MPRKENGEPYYRVDSPEANNILNDETVFATTIKNFQNF